MKVYSKQQLSTMTNNQLFQIQQTCDVFINKCKALTNAKDWTSFDKEVDKYDDLLDTARTAEESHERYVDYIYFLQIQTIDGLERYFETMQVTDLIKLFK